MSTKRGKLWIPIFAPSGVLIGTLLPDEIAENNVFMYSMVTAIVVLGIAVIVLVLMASRKSTTDEEKTAVKKEKSAGVSESGMQSTSRVFHPEVKEAPDSPSSPMPQNKSHLSESGLQSTKLNVTPKVKKAPETPTAQPTPKWTK